MCDPVSALMAAGTAVSAIGTLRAGDAAQNTANFNAYQLTQEAAYADQQAADTLARSEEDIREIQKAGSRVRGAAVASASASNIDASFGSPLDMILDNARNVETDVMRTAENARREADDIRFGASQTRGRAAITRMEGQQQKAASRMSAVGNVLSGGAGIYRYRASVNAPRSGGVGRVE